MPFPIEVTGFAEDVDGRAVSVVYDLAAQAPVLRVKVKDAVRLARRWELRRVMEGESWMFGEPSASRVC